MSEHAFLAPSAAAIWRHCAAYPSLAPLFPEPDTDAAREGTAAHWCASEHLNGRPRAVGAVAPNGVVITQEMIDGAMVYVDECVATLARLSGSGALTHAVEQHLKIDRIHPDYCEGTPDFWTYNSAARRLVLVDFKYGHGQVDAEENDQLVTYAAGILEKLKVNGLDEQSLTVEIVIVQPRCFTADGSVRRWVTNAAALRGQINILAGAAQTALLPKPAATSGSHCKWCPARHSCPTSRRATYSALDYSRTGMIEPLTPDAVSFELGMLERAEELIKSRIVAMEEQARQFIRSGKPVPGFDLRETNGNLAWLPTMPVDQIKALGESYGVSLVDEKLITPTQAKKKGIDEAVISAYASRPSTGLKLVKADLNRITRIIKSNGVK